jgi:hypothetical protein
VLENFTWDDYRARILHGYARALRMTNRRSP